MASNLVEVVISCSSSSAVSGFQTAASAATSFSAQVTAAAGGASSSLTSVGSSAGIMGGLIDAAGTVALAGIAALTAAAAGIGTAIGASVGEAVKFQTLLTNIQNNTTMTASDVGVMHDTILKLAGETGSSFDKLGAGFMHITNLTGDSAHAMDILSVANESAVSTGGDVEKTANILTNAMHEYGLDVSTAATETGKHTEIQANAARIMGVFHLAAAEANLTLEQFANSSGRAVGVAANLKIPVEDVSAAMAALTKHGYNAAEAQTQVVNMMTHIIHPAAAATAEIQKLSKASGVDLVRDFTAAGLQSKGLHGVIDDMRTAMQHLGMNEAEVTGETMKLLNAQRGGLGAATLIGTAASDYNNILKDLNDTQKTTTITHEAFLRTQQTVGFQWGVLKSQIAVASEELGERFLPAVSSVLGFISTTVVPVLKDGLGAAMTWLSGTALPALSSAWQALQGPLQTAATLVQTVISAFSTGDWSQVTAQLAALGTKLVSWITDAAPKAESALGEFITNAATFITTKLPTWVESLAQFGIRAVMWISDKLPALGENLGKFFNKMENWVVNNLPTWGERLATMGAKITSWVLDALPMLGVNLGEFAGNLFAWILQTAIDVVPKIADMAAKFLNWVNDVVMPALPGVLERIFVGISNFLNGVDRKVDPLIEALAVKFYDWVTTTVLPALPGYLDQIGNALGNWIISAATTVYTEVISIGSAIVNGIKAGIDAAWGAFTSWIHSKIMEIPSVIRDFLHISSPSQVMADEVGQWIPKGIAAGIDAHAHHVTNAMQRLAAVVAQPMSIGSLGASAYSMPSMGSMPNLSAPSFSMPNLTSSGPSFSMASASGSVGSQSDMSKSAQALQGVSNSYALHIHSSATAPTDPVQSMMMLRSMIG